jgi:hypothetical protein
MNYPMPLIALFTVGIKFLIKKYNNYKLSGAFLIFGFFAAMIVFYAGFGHLLSPSSFILVTFMPLLCALITTTFEHYGLSRYSIPACMILNAFVVGNLFYPFGIIKALQATWAMCLISSVTTTLNTEFIKPYKQERAKKHGFSI